FGGRGPSRGPPLDEERPGSGKRERRRRRKGDLPDDSDAKKTLDPAPAPDPRIEIFEEDRTGGAEQEADQKREGDDLLLVRGALDEERRRRVQDLHFRLGDGALEPHLGELLVEVVIVALGSAIIVLERIILSSACTHRFEARTLAVAHGPKALLGGRSGGAFRGSFRIARLGEGAPGIGELVLEVLLQRR